MLMFVLAAAQSLGEAARKEAARRKALDEQGVQARVIEVSDPSQLAPGGNLCVSSAPPPSAVRPGRAENPAPKSGSRARLAIQKLDRDIRATEDRLSTLRRQAEAERWAPPRTGKTVRRGGAVQNEERIREEISDLDLKLKRLRQQRLETYNDARRAGLLPGEIDGKGLIP